MRIHMGAMSRALLAIIGMTAPVSAFGQQGDQPALSRAEQVLQQSAEQGRFTFVVFYKSNNAAVQAMATAIENGIASKAGQATTAFVGVADPNEKKLVDRLGVGRAPMPLGVAFAPNGAVTGLFTKVPSADAVAKAFVTPTMSQCMKAMQEGKIVLVCIQGAGGDSTPAAVASFHADSQFKDRVATVTLDTADPAEVDFLKQLEMNQVNSGKVATVMLAPPGVLVGKYTAEVSFDKMAADLHAAGKCCDDPNCKHHQRTDTNADPSTSRYPSAMQRK